MNVSANLVEASINPYGQMIITYEVVCPPWVWIEILTHRVFSRNANSTRAISLNKVRDFTAQNPMLPRKVYLEQKGMGSTLEHPDQIFYNEISVDLMDKSIEAHKKLSEAGYCKQDVNILLYPWFSYTGVITATDFQNFFSLRVNPLSRPDMRDLATQMYIIFLKLHGFSPAQIETLLKEKLNGQFDESYLKNFLNHSIKEPEVLNFGEFHLPYISSDEKMLELNKKQKVSIARCARRLVRLGESKIEPLHKDLDLYERLRINRHLSPFEHVASPCVGRNDNFSGWQSYRNLIELETKKL